MIPIRQAQLNNQIYKERRPVPLVEITDDEAMRMMLKKFGGKAASSFLARQDNLKINVELVRGDIDSSRKDAPKVVQDGVNFESFYDKMRPKCNKNAKNLAEVYAVDDIIPTKLLTSLDDEAADVFKTELRELQISSDFIRQLFKNIQGQNCSILQLQKVKLVIYMDCLLNFLTSKTSNMRYQQISGISNKVEKDVRRRFCDLNTRNLRRARCGKEKAICYFIVLALLTDDKYEANLTVLHEELHISRKQIIFYGKLVNSMVKRNSDILSLRLPSMVPPVKLMYRKSRNWRNPI